MNGKLLLTRLWLTEQKWHRRTKCPVDGETSLSLLTFCSQSTRHNNLVLQQCAVFCVQIRWHKKIPPQICHGLLRWLSEWDSTILGGAPNPGHSESSHSFWRLSHTRDCHCRVGAVSSTLVMSSNLNNSDF